MTIRCISGPAPLTPLTPSTGRTEKFPAHTATVKPRVVPTAQLSQKWRLVPVFPATGNGKSNGVDTPNPGICLVHNIESWRGTGMAKRADAMRTVA
jgi:hypothetical protein